MKIEENVLSIEQAKHLRELGLDMSDAALCWYATPYHKIVWQITTMVGRMNEYVKEKEYSNLIPTYTLQEILGKLPEEIYYPKETEAIRCELYILPKERSVVYSEELYAGRSAYGCSGESLFEAAYKMLCWLLENGYLEDHQTK